jgi:site-specific DNA recombinase
MNVAIYSRKSKFIEGSESIENQIQMCKEYISKNYKDSNTFLYEDEGFSGGNTNRPNFQKLIKDIKNKKFNILMCYRLDRISRNVADFSTTLELLEQYNVAFISIKEQFDTSTPMGKAMVYIASVFAQLERETIAERIRDNMIELAKNGKWLGGKVPLGYTRVGSAKNTYLKLEPADANIIKKIYNTYIEKGSIYATSKWCLEHNVRRKNGNNFAYNALSFTLKNPVYCIADLDFYNYAVETKMIICNSEEEFKNNMSKGVTSYDRTFSNKTSILKPTSNWIISIGKHEGIIQGSAWVKVQRLLKANYSKYPRQGTSGTALLGGLLKCANCGSNMKISYEYKEGKKDIFYYRCYKKVNTRGIDCSIKNLNGRKTDEFVLNRIIDISQNEDKLNKIYKEYSKNSNVPDNEINIKKMKIKIKQNKDDIEKLTIKLIDAENSVASKYIIKKIESLDLEIQSLEKQISEFEDKTFLYKQREKDFYFAFGNIKYLSADIKNLDIDRKKELIRSVVKEVVWDGKRIGLKLKL